MNERLSPTIPGSSRHKSAKQLAKEKIKAQKCQTKINVLQEIIDGFSYPDWMVTSKVPLPVIPPRNPLDQPSEVVNQDDPSFDDLDQHQERQENDDEEDWIEPSDSSNPDDGNLSDATYHDTSTSPIVID